MGKVTGFLEFERHDRVYEPVKDRIKTWKEFVVPMSEQDLRNQAARCWRCRCAKPTSRKLQSGHKRG